MSSKIEWTGETWNPITGCSKISDGCQNCYARVMAKRLKAMRVEKYSDGFRLALHTKELEKPLSWKKPRTIFVCSMSDLFHSDVPTEFIEAVFETIEQTPQHAYQILTKRADRLADFFESRACPPNAWLGVTVENREHGLPRIDFLRQVKAPIRFLSLEPLLEALDGMDLRGLDWVIIGGESGPKARPFDLIWCHKIIKQCGGSDIPVFVKQLGANPVYFGSPDWPRGYFGPNGENMDKWPASLRIRQMPIMR